MMKNMRNDPRMSIQEFIQLITNILNGGIVTPQEAHETINQESQPEVVENTQPSEYNGYSLHIGLNKVNPNFYGGWDGRLAGCINDANDMQNLAKNSGFVVHNQLIDGAATLQAISTNIADLASKAKYGDTVLITYSGHGGSIEDDNADEPDKKDETWVLFDGQMIDDQLYLLLKNFVHGVKIVVISDSCHSGSITRSGYGDRSIQQYAAGANYAIQRPQLALARALKRASKDPFNATVLLLSGCADNQYSMDGKKNGLFTEKLLANYRKDLSWKNLHSAILRDMPSTQSPKLFVYGSESESIINEKAFSY